MTSAYIYMQLPGEATLTTLGRLDVDKDVGVFIYNPEYVEQKGWVPDPVRYPLRKEPFVNVVTNGGLPGFIRDAAPDGWGERVIAYGMGQSLSGIDYLRMSSNVDRAGSLLVGVTRKPATTGHLDRLQRLDDFIAFADGLQSGEHLSVAALRAARQRTSLGGARPKVTLLDNDRIILAKPKDRHDIPDVPVFEHACMTFAASHGMTVARTRLHKGAVSVLLVDRFDRVATREGDFLRLPMLSALSLLDVDWKSAEGRARWRYAEVADEMRRRGVCLADLQELFMRMCFNALIGNDDDHPKNHAVIFQNGKWRLSPMYDVVPALDGVPPQALAMDVGRLGKIITRENLLSHAEHFGHTQDSAAQVLDEVASWENELKSFYRSTLSSDQAELAICSMNAVRLRA